MSIHYFPPDLGHQTAGRRISVGQTGLVSISLSVTTGPKKRGVYRKCKSRLKIWIKIKSQYWYAWDLGASLHGKLLPPPCSICLMLAFDGQLRRREMVAKESRGYQRRFRQSPQLQAERGVGGWGGGAKGMCINASTSQRLRLVASQRSAAVGPTGTSLSGSMAYTPHGAHRLIPRLKFTFAPSRLNSHFSSSHNSPLSRHTEIMGSSCALHAK